jgi:hypothetical protein
MKQKGKSIFLMSLVFLLLVYLVGDFLVNSSKEIIIQGFFTNDDYNFFPASELKKDYGSYLKIDDDKRINFEDGLYLELGSSKDYTTASSSKIMAYAASHELDFLVLPKDLMLHYITGFALENLEEYTDSSLESELFYGEDGNQEYKAVAINMKTSKFVNDDERGSEYYLIIPASSKRKAAVKTFLEYAFSIE